MSIGKLNNVKKIIIHCSDSSWGTVNDIDDWHRKRGFDKVGYHYVILNGYPMGSDYVEKFDGLLEPGRALDEMGAHVKGHNDDSIGICLIGKRLFSPKQLLETLPNTIAWLLSSHGLSIEDVLGHCELDKHKTCPNIDMDRYRDFLIRNIKER